MTPKEKSFIKNVAKILPQDSQADVEIEQAAKERAELHQEYMTNRKWLIRLLAWISCIWLGFTAIIVIMVGIPCDCFQLSDPVMIAFLTNTLGIVLGLWGFGLRYFFGKHH